MRQAQFEAEHSADWSRIDALLSGKAADAAELPALYRRLCQALALARQRGYSPALADYLQKLVSDCHQALYGAVVERPMALREWLLREMPRRVREEWRLLIFVLLAFWGVALAVGLAVWLDANLAYSFIDPQQLAAIERMYQPSRDRLGRGGADSDVMMFGFYIWNNVSISFRTFAAGIFAGVPALLSLTFNGMHLGVVGAWLSRDAATASTFWSFVITHASFEITGLLLAALAGMRLGLALLSPRRLTRRSALLAASRRMFPVLVGAAMLTVLAAFFEAFWSANGALDVNVKFAVGGACWFAVIAFFALAGRASNSH
jgi:uncharacterized membrane protein SpoIIM required for sporulation